MIQRNTDKKKGAAADAHSLHFFLISFVEPALPSSRAPGSGRHLVSNHQHAGTEVVIQIRKDCRD